MTIGLTATVDVLVNVLADVLADVLLPPPPEPDFGGYVSPLLAQVPF